MIRLVAVAFVLAVATSAQAMSPVPLHQPDGMTTSRSPPTPTVLRARSGKWGCPRCGADGICMLVVPPLGRHPGYRRFYEYY